MGNIGRVRPGTGANRAWVNELQGPGRWVAWVAWVKKDSFGADWAGAEPAACAAGVEVSTRHTAAPFRKPEHTHTARVPTSHHQEREPLQQGGDVGKGSVPTPVPPPNTPFGVWFLTRCMISSRGLPSIVKN